MDRKSERGRRYRSWPESLKREIVAASLAPGASVSRVARRYDVNTNQLFRWRQQYRETIEGVPMARGLSMVPVSVTPIDGTDAPSVAGLAADGIEIVLGRGYRVRVGAGFDGLTLSRVLDVLERRR